MRLFRFATIIYLVVAGSITFTSESEPKLKLSILRNISPEMVKYHKTIVDFTYNLHRPMDWVANRIRPDLAGEWSVTRRTDSHLKHGALGYHTVIDGKKKGVPAILVLSSKVAADGYRIPGTEGAWTSITISEHK